MKKHLILISLLLVNSLVIKAQGKLEDILYVPFPNNEKFEGTYIFEDSQQRFVMTLVNKKREPIKKGGDTFTDMLVGDISYIKNGRSILKKNEKMSHIASGFTSIDSLPNVAEAHFFDQERKQSGRVTLTLNPEDSTAVFKLDKANRKGDFYVIFDEASRRRAEEKQERYKRPFAIPDSLVLKKQ